MKGYLTEPSLFGHPFITGFGDDDFYLKEISRDSANDIIKKNHYSKKFYSASYIHLGVYIEKNIVGCLQFGYAMNPASQAGVVGETEQDEYLELNRMWLDDIAPRNSESRSISYAIKYIKSKYPKIKWIQSFADERCGKFGIVYQAANFKYYGEHMSTFWEWRGMYYHNILMTAHGGKEGDIGKLLQAHKDEAIKHDFRQFRYIYFIDKRYEKKCLLEEKPFEKYYKIS